MKKIIKFIVVLFIGLLTFLTGQTMAEHIKIKQKVKTLQI